MLSQDLFRKAVYFTLPTLHDVLGLGISVFIPSRPTSSHASPRVHDYVLGQRPPEAIAGLFA